MNLIYTILILGLLSILYAIISVIFETDYDKLD